MSLWRAEEEVQAGEEAVATGEGAVGVAEEEGCIHQIASTGKASATRQKSK